MINIQINKKVVAAMAAVLMFGSFSVSSSAAFIDAGSEIAFFGTYTPDNADLSLASSLSFGAPVIIAAGANDFAFAVGGNATFDTINFGVTTFGGLGSSVLSFANGGAFTATSISVDFQTSTALDLTMAGYWSLNGFDDTLGQLVLTADALGNGGLYTFSAAGTVQQPIPVPAAIWLLGSALAGLGLTRRRTA